MHAQLPSADASPLHCLRSSNAEQPVLTRQCVGSSPTGGTTRTRPLGAALRCQRRSGGFESRRPLERPCSTKVVRRSRKPRASVRFRPRARSFQRSKTVLHSAVNRGGAGSSPAAGARLRLLTDQDLRLRISGWRFESARSHAASSSPGGEVGFIRRACRVRSPGLLLPRCGSTWLERAVRDRETGGSNPLTSTTRRAAHLGVIAVLQTARAGFDSLARYGVRSVVVARENVALVATGSIPFAHPQLAHDATGVAAPLSTV